MLVDAAHFLLSTLLESYAWLLIARFHLQWLRAPMRNPLGEFIMLLTNPLVLPLRRVIPAIKMLDTASLLLAFGVELAYMAASLWLDGVPLDTWLLPAWAVVRLVRGSIYLLLVALFLEALISWTYPNAPFGPLLRSVTSPFLRPLRRLVPPKGGLDFAFLILFFVCFIILRLVVDGMDGMIWMAIKHNGMAP